MTGAATCLARYLLAGVLLKSVGREAFLVRVFVERNGAEGRVASSWPPLTR